MYDYYTILQTHMYHNRGLAEDGRAGVSPVRRRPGSSAIHIYIYIKQHNTSIK